MNINFIPFILLFSILIYIWKDTLLFDKFLTLLLPKSFKKFREENYSFTFTEALEMRYPNIITSLLNCPFCLSFWSNLVFMTIVVLSTGKDIYFYQYLPFTLYLTYIFYLLIVKLEK